MEQNQPVDDKDSIPPLDMAELPYQGWEAERESLRQMLRDVGITENSGPLEQLLNQIHGQLPDDSPNKALVDQVRQNIRELPMLLDGRCLADLLEDCQGLETRIADLYLTELVHDLRSEGTVRRSLVDALALKVGTVKKLAARLAPDLDCFDRLAKLEQLVTSWRTVLSGMFPFKRRYPGSSLEFGWQNLEIAGSVAPAATVLHLEFCVKFVDILATQTMKAVGPGLRRRLLPFLRAWAEYLGTLTPFLGVATPPSLSCEPASGTVRELPDSCDPDITDRLHLLIQDTPTTGGLLIWIGGLRLLPPGKFSALEAAAQIDRVTIAAQTTLQNLLRNGPGIAPPHLPFFEKLNDYLRSVKPIFGDAIIGQVDLTPMHDYIAKAAERRASFLRDGERVLGELIASLPEYSQASNLLETMEAFRHHPGLAALSNHHRDVEPQVLASFKVHVESWLEHWLCEGLLSELDLLLRQWSPSLEKAMPAGVPLGGALVRWEELSRHVQSTHLDGPRDARSLHSYAVHVAHLATATVADLAARSPRPGGLLREVAPFFPKLNGFLTSAGCVLHGDTPAVVDLSPLGTLETADEYDEHVEPPSVAMEADETPYSAGMDLDEDPSPFYS